MNAIWQPRDLHKLLMRCKQKSTSVVHTCEYMSVLYRSISTWNHWVYSKTLDRERTSLMAERERQNQKIRTLENEYATRQLEESEMKNKMKDQDSLTKEIETLTKDNEGASARLKVCPREARSGGDLFTHPLVVGDRRKACWGAATTAEAGTRTEAVPV